MLLLWPIPLHVCPDSAALLRHFSTEQGIAGIELSQENRQHLIALRGLLLGVTCKLYGIMASTGENYSIL